MAKVDIKISEMHLEELTAFMKFIKQNNINKILETGVLHGFSSIRILDTIKEDGMLVSIEKNPVRIVKLIDQAHLKKWYYLVNDCKIMLPKAFDLFGKFDMFFHDSDHSYEHQTFEYETAMPHCQYVASHDASDTHKVNRPAFRDFVKKHNLKIVFKIRRLKVAQIF